MIEVDKVIVPVDDQERAKRFWTETMGFELVQDERYRDERWLEVRPPSGSPVLVLSLRTAASERPSVPDELPHSPVLFACADLPKTYEALSAKGVRFAVAPVEMEFGWWSMFEDPDGTRYALGQ